VTYVPAPSTGALFRNDKKDAEHPQRPDYVGSLTLPDGSTLKLGGWVTEGATGKYLSLKVSALLPPVQTPD
jgi:hypothetical protein